jgi:hypothetical protein
VPRIHGMYATLGTHALAAVARRRILFRGLRCKPDGMGLMLMCQMRLICGRQNILRLLKFGGFAMVPCGVLVMFSRLLMKFA